MGYVVKHSRIKEKYRPQPNALEKRFELKLREHLCIGCGAFGVELHHTMLAFPGKRWRRDHRYQLPVCGSCHRGTDGIHGLGCEAKWGRINEVDTAAIAQQLWQDFINDR